ncbi:hypothetical protein TNCV_2139811 [Trichonephila clavipes]|uniref:Uncharacterized protein n=1 Tax=Trichonephila clavipes TaxID=2585209 RepID=A0A8X6RUR9_TRICX|nr:hypothetical protein TNCV_2139811 [Trichonephila clavipes]
MHVKSVDSSNVLPLVREGRESVEDDKRSRRPQTSSIAENIVKVSEAARMKRPQTIAEIYSATCQWIPTKDLNMHRVSQHIVPSMLNKDQSVDEIKRASQVEQKEMAKNGFQKCFDDL